MRLRPRALSPGASAFRLRSARDTPGTRAAMACPASPSPFAVVEIAPSAYGGQERPVRRACTQQRTTAARLALGPQQPSALPLPAALFLGFTLVVQLLAARERKLELGAALQVEIKLERHEGHALALDRTQKLV